METSRGEKGRARKEKKGRFNDNLICLVFIQIRNSANESSAQRVDFYRSTFVCSTLVIYEKPTKVEVESSCYNQQVSKTRTNWLLLEIRDP